MKSKLVGLTLGTTVLTVALAATAAADPLIGGAKSQSAHAKVGTSTTIGQTDPGATTCGPPITAVQATSAGPSYTVPSRGVITSWSTKGNAGVGQARVVAFTAAGANWTLVGKSALTPVAVNTLNTFPARVPVPAGAQLGIQITAGAMDCGFVTGVGTDLFQYSLTFNPDADTTLTPSNLPNVHANISAVVESDADGDGYGDVTQDACPESALTQAACPAPNTKVTKKPKKTSTQRNVKIKFSSTIAGSTFTCKVDKKAAKTCKSPLKKKFKYGKHKVVITAISPFGIVDPTPVKVKFKILKP